MELINNILSELFPIAIIGLSLWIGVKNWDKIDNISRKIFGKGLEEEQPQHEHINIQYKPY